MKCIAKGAPQDRLLDAVEQLATSGGLSKNRLADVVGRRGICRASPPDRSSTKEECHTAVMDRTLAASAGPWRSLAAIPINAGHLLSAAMSSSGPGLLPDGAVMQAGSKLLMFGAAADLSEPLRGARGLVSPPLVESIWNRAFGSIGGES